jgi:hypothetical protein
VYIDCDDPGALFDRAVASGAEVVRGLKEEDYGSRGFTVRDPEGNLWSFGTYDGEARPDHDEPQSTIDTFASLLADWAEALVANDAEAIGAFAEPDWVFRRRERDRSRLDVPRQREQWPGDPQRDDLRGCEGPDNG